MRSRFEMTSADCICCSLLHTCTLHAHAFFRLLALGHMSKMKRRASTKGSRVASFGSRDFKGVPVVLSKTLLNLSAEWLAQSPP